MKQTFRFNFYDPCKCFTSTEFCLFIININDKVLEQKIKITFFMKQEKMLNIKVTIYRGMKPA
jgi:hypothetical protein